MLRRSEASVEWYERTRRDRWTVAAPSNVYRAKATIEILEVDNFDQRRECANEKIEDYSQRELEKRL
jgi:hypothetical protein